MVAFLLITHGSLGKSLQECAEHVMGGPLERFSVLSVDRSADPELMREQARQHIAALAGEEGVLVLSDIYGATPCNIASRLPGTRVALVSGVSLPMLIRALTYRKLSLPEVVAKAVSGGRDGIVVVEAPPETADCKDEAAHA